MLYELPQSAAIVDIVFVHGLGGNAYTTWLHMGTNIHWPSALLRKKVPDARIITFGYDADVVNWWHEASTNRVTNHAECMIGELVRLREETKTEDREIVFVAHSLGGLVTEAVIYFSRHSPFEHIRQIEKNTVGIVFLGTPHLGADAAKWKAFATRLISVIKHANVNIVELLQPDSEMLAIVQKNFQGVLRNRLEEKRPVEISCFYEELGVGPLGEVSIHDTIFNIFE